MLGIRDFLKSKKVEPAYTWHDLTAQQIVKDHFPKMIEEYVNSTGLDCLQAIEDLDIAVASVYMPNFDQELAEELGL